MECPKCKHVSLAGSNFCEKCGHDLKAHTRQKARAVDPYSYGTSYGSSASNYPSGERYHGAPSSYGSHPTPSPSPAPAPAPAPRPAAAAAPPPPTSSPTPVRSAPPPPIPDPPRPRRPGGQINAPSPAPSAQYAPQVPEAPQAFAHLESVDGHGPKFALIYDRNEVGRLSAEDNIRPQVDLTSCDRDGTVSRQHAVIYKEESFVVLEDRGSRNGTFVNGTRLESGQQFTLTNGAEVRFGTVSFRYRNSQ